MNTTTTLPRVQSNAAVTPFAAVRGSQLAAELDDAQCEVLSRLITLRDLAHGEVVVREGVPDDHLYGVLRGTLGHIKNDGTPNAITLNTVSAGEFSGELSFLDGLPRYGSLVALGDASVFALTRDQLESLLESHADIVYRLMRAIVRTVHQVQRRLSVQCIE